MKTYRVVLDTNILVAASRSRLGASFALLERLKESFFISLVSVPLLLEYEAVLKRPEHLAFGNRTADMVDLFLDAFCLYAEPIHLHYLWRPQTRDPADEMVLETALNGAADALITLNTADFWIAQNFRLPVWTPGYFLHQLEKESSNG